MVALDTSLADPLAPELDHPVDPTALIAAMREQPMSGWLDLPVEYDREEFARIQAAAAQINTDSEYLVCIGIGGSYLGHRAVIEALGNPSPTKILYAGNSFDGAMLQEVLDTIEGHDWSINVISKSGTTTEPAVAFRILRAALEAKYGAAASARIYATTDANVGALHDEAVARGYQRFVIPDHIGGRYSVLTAVGLLPIATAGIDIVELMAGATEQRQTLLPSGGIAANYAILRNRLYQRGFATEIYATFAPRLLYFGEWWKQLTGESEGKDHKGLYPASVVDSTDLHSLGQFIQDGPRNLIETVVKITTPPAQVITPSTTDDLDGLNYLAGKSLDFINEQARLATVQAHATGGVPVIQIAIPDLSARSLGALIYFYELSIALSGLILGVNPFDQPGVEIYKVNMFKLLGKPGA
jgi:glucose-6-phosphate isomerase